MSFITHFISLLVICFFSLSFYYDYQLFNNISYIITRDHLLNVYNGAYNICSTAPVYIVVHSQQYVKNITAVGDMITGNIGTIPVYTSKSTIGMTDLQYYQYIKIMPAADIYGLIVQDCTILIPSATTWYDINSILVGVIVLLSCIIIYGVLNRVWLCFTMCRTQEYSEIN